MREFQEKQLKTLTLKMTMTLKPLELLNPRPQTLDS